MIHVPLRADERAVYSNPITYEALCQRLPGLETMQKNLVAGREFRSEDDLLVGMATLVRMPGLSHVIEAVTVVTEKAREYVPSIYFAVDRAMESEYLVMNARSRVRRVQCHVDVADQTAIHFAERLGFVHEGVMVGYGRGGEDMAIMRLEAPWQQR